MTQVKIKVKEDYRCFKKDDEYEVHVVDYNKVTMIPGDLYFEIHTGWIMTLEKCNKIPQDT